MNVSKTKRTGRRPFGFYPDEAAVVEMIRLKRRVRKGQQQPTPFGQIARELNEQGFKSQTGRLWRAEQVRRILQKPVPNRPKGYPKKTQLNRSDYLSRSQIAACRAVFRDGYESLIFETLLGSAARAAELCSVQLRDLNLEAEPYEINIRCGKGGKQRSVTIGPRLAAKLKKYAKKRSKNAGRRASLFTNRRGKPLAYHNLRYLMTAIGKRAGIMALHPHVLRHTWATLQDYDTSAFRIRDQLGHSSLDTTAIYAKVSKKQRIQAAKDFEEMLNGPLNNKRLS